MGLRKIRIGLRIAKTVHYSTAKRNTKTDCFPEFSARKSSNFKLELWLNEMTYSFGTNTSRFLWFSRF